MKSAIVDLPFRSMRKISSAFLSSKNVSVASQISKAESSWVVFGIAASQSIFTTTL